MTIRIAHIITTLDIGGAETMLYGLLTATDRDRFAPTVITLKAGAGALIPKIEALGITVRQADIKPSLPNPFSVRKVAHWLREDRIDVVQTWMFHANLIGGMAARSERIPTAWGIQAGHLQRGQEKATTMMIRRMGGPMSRYVPEKIVYCAQVGQQAHEAIGYMPEKGVFIPNGFDIKRYRPDAADRTAVRMEIGLPVTAPLIGYMARWHPLKGHRTFIEAAGIIRREFPAVRLLMCGTEITWDNAELVALLDAAGLRENAILLGRRDDIPRLLRTLDLFALASDSEGFPMAAGEAMASGVTPVLTSAGDARLLVGEAGRVVALHDVDGFAAACIELLRDDATRSALGRAARERIEAQFSLSAVAEQYMTLHEALAEGKR